MQKLVKTQKSTNNPMSIFGLIEEDTELPHIHLAVNTMFFADIFQNLIWKIKISFPFKIFILRSNSNQLYIPEFKTL